MLLHRSSSRFRSTMWSKTSSLGRAAERPRRVPLARVPSPSRPCLCPPPAHPHPLPGSLGLVSWATHTKSPTCSLRTVWVTCSRCSSRSSSGLGPALELHGGRPEGRPGPSPRPLPHLPPPHSPLGLANVHAQQHPVLSRSQLQRWLLDVPFAGATTGKKGWKSVCARPGLLLL